MKKEVKAQVMEAIAAQLQECPNFYITDIAGLNAEKTSKLRRDCFEQGIKLTVVKNTLFEKVLKDSGDKLPADIKSQIEGALGKLKDAHKSQDLAAIDTASAELNSLFEKMYQQAGGAQGGPQGAGFDPSNMGGAGFQGGPTGGAPNQGGDNVEDTTYEEVK